MQTGCNHRLRRPILRKETRSRRAHGSPDDDVVRSRTQSGGRMTRQLLISVCALFTIAVAFNGPAPAAPNVADLPEPLRPWVDWVLHGHEDARCPFLSGT